MVPNENEASLAHNDSTNVEAEEKAQALSGTHKHDHSHHQHDGPSEHLHGGTILTIRSHSGLSGDMLLAGLMRMTEISSAEIAEILKGLLPNLDVKLNLTTRQINQISGWHVEIKLPPQHEHRHLNDILKIIKASSLSSAAQDLATQAFTILAQAEACVHQKEVSEVHFHEVGALDSIIDTCLSCELFTRLDLRRFVLSPLPLADGSVHCAHGLLPVPAPAVLQLLPGLAVKSFAGCGETVTPTAAALLNVLPVDFGPWPTMLVKKTALVFGDYVFQGVPNGATFALGVAL